MKAVKRDTHRRWQLMDAMRGLAVCLMVVHHLLYDLYYFGFAPYTVFSNQVFDCLHYIFLGVFIVLSGISSRFSRSNGDRGLKLLACAAVVTLATWLIGAPAWFGVLHFLALAILLYWAVGRFLEKIPFNRGIYLSGVLFCLSLLFIRTTGLEWKVLWFFGKSSVLNIYSADYVPLFPWLFVFYFGTVLGGKLREKKPPEPSRSRPAAFMAGVGQKSLLIYMLHQPVLYGAVWCAREITDMI